MKTHWPNIPKHPPRAFTLLEVVLAVAVTGIISAALFTSMSGAFKARRQVEENLLSKESARSAMTVIRADLLCIPPAGGRISGVFKGEDDAGPGNQDADLMSYITANPGLRSEQDLADLRQVQLRLLQSQEDSDHYVLARLVTGNLLARSTPEPTVQVLARRVVSLSLQYFDGGEWLSEWDSTLRENELPIAVQVVLVVAPQLSRQPRSEQEKQSSYFTISQVFRLPAALDATTTGDSGINLGF